MGHPQPPTPLHADNSTAVKLKIFNVSWHPGQKNLADYPTKHHTVPHHQHVHPYYVHTTGSPRFLPRAPAPCVL
eukprot:12690341-Ditylum_brightwellii.AAC.1